MFLIVYVRNYGNVFSGSFKIPFYSPVNLFKPVDKFKNVSNIVFIFTNPHPHSEVVLLTILRKSGSFLNT